MAMLNLIAIGPQLPAWVNDGVNDYHKRFPTQYPLTITALPLAKQRHDVAKAKLQESTQLFHACKPGSMIIELHERGQLLKSTELATQLTRWWDSYSSLCFLIGGPDGIDATVGHVHYRWSLSPLTFPHAIARLLVVEQLYRALMIIKGHPYHRE